MARLKPFEDLVPVSDFRIRTAEVVARVKKNRRPVILTQRGRSAAVLEDVREYERRVERLELLEAILDGIRAAEQGAVVSHDKAMTELDKILNS